MFDWIDSMAGPGYGAAIMWTVGALILLAFVLVAIRVARGLTSDSFMRGNRNRRTRLSVIDATPVDTNRRLILVRRDDREHLILIGGPTDVVVEQHIPVAAEELAQHNEAAARTRPAGSRLPRFASFSRTQRPKAAAGKDPAPDTARRAPPPTRPIPPTAAQDPAPSVEPRPQPPGAREKPAARPEPRPEPVHAAPAAAPTVDPSPRTPMPAQHTPAQHAPPVGNDAARAPQAASSAREHRIEPEPPRAASSRDDMDVELMEELEVTLEGREPSDQSAAQRRLDDDMARLLGDLSGAKRSS